MKTKGTAAVAVGIVALGWVAASASPNFHFMQIEQVIGGVNGDTMAQAIQLRMRAPGQNIVSLSRLRIWDAQGNPSLLINLPNNVPNGALGSRVLIASPNFVNATFPATTPDFTLTNLIPVSVLAAGSLTFESNAGTIYWRLSWGGDNYTGSTTGSAFNDDDGDYGPPFPGPLPSACHKALRFLNSASAQSTTNADDYALTSSSAVFTNNAGMVSTVPNVGKCCTDAGCDDLIDCTTDGCVLGTCTNAPDDGACDNGDFCDGTETCNGIFGCVTEPGSVPDCDDGVGCTNDSCDELNDICVNAPDTGACDDALFCTGTETCDPVNDCVSTGSPCGFGEFCNEDMDLCEAAPVVPIGLQPVAGGTIPLDGSPLVSPVAMAHAGDGSGRLFIVDQAGQIRIVDATGTLLAEPFLDLSALIVTLNPGFDERGVLGLAFHPDYANNGRFFVRYSAPRKFEPGEPCDGPPFGCHKAVLSEFAVSKLDPDLADDTSEHVLFEVDEPQFNHDAGHVAFGPDGLLYFTLGDGGGAHDGLADDPPSHGPIGNGQNTFTVLGSVLRIDVDSPPDTGLEYAIPPGNVFADGVDGAKEIYAYGMRNPYRFSFDDGPGGDDSLLVADVGQALFEELNVVVNGGNYGWVIREGFHCFDPFAPDFPPADCATEGELGEPLLDPVMEYLHAVGCIADVDCADLGVGCDEEAGLCENEGGLAIIGGHVYRGSRYPGLEGVYVFGDFSADFGATGRLFHLTTAGPSAFLRNSFFLAPDDAPLGQFLKGFGEDQDGEIYVLASDDLGPTGTSGVVYHVVLTPPPSVTAVGPRALSVQLPLGETNDDLALLLTADDAPCLALYVQSDGTLDVNPVFQSDDAWDGVVITGTKMAPDTTYKVQADYGSPGSPLPSAPASATTCPWGDVNCDLVPDLDDILCVIDGFGGDFSACSLAALDLSGCTPNGVIDLDDILGVIGGFGGAEFPCPPLCP